jgi:hypothetical protein
VNQTKISFAEAFSTSAAWLAIRFLAVVANAILLGLFVAAHADMEWYLATVNIVIIVVSAVVIATDVVVAKLAEKRRRISSRKIESAESMSSLGDSPDCQSASVSASDLRVKIERYRVKTAQLTMTVASFEKTKTKYAETKKVLTASEKRTGKLEGAIEITKALVKSQKHSINLLDSILSNILELGADIEDFGAVISQSLTEIKQTFRQIEEILEIQPLEPASSVPDFVNTINSPKFKRKKRLS